MIADVSLRISLFDCVTHFMNCSTYHDDDDNENDDDGNNDADDRRHV